MHEAEALLAALRSAGNANASTSGRVVGAEGTGGAPTSKRGVGSGGSAGGHGTSSGLSSLLSMSPESINWQHQAIMVYRDMVTSGQKPGVDVLDMMLGCLRVKHITTKEEDYDDDGGTSSASSSSSVTPLMHHHLSKGVGGHHNAGGAAMPSHLGGLPLHLSGGGRPGVGMLGLGGVAPMIGRQPWEAPLVAGTTASSSAAGGTTTSNVGRVERSGQRYEIPFDKRALGILEDAMSKGFLPSIRGVDEGPFTVDLRTMPPTVSEVTVLAVLMAFERRAVKTGIFPIIIIHHIFIAKS